MMVRVPHSAARTLPVRLILIGIAIARARRRCIALIVEHDIVGWWRSLQAAALSLQFQVETTLLRIPAADLVRRSRAGEA